MALNTCKMEYRLKDSDKMNQHRPKRCHANKNMLRVTDIKNKDLYLLVLTLILFNSTLEKNLFGEKRTDNCSS